MKGSGAKNYLPDLISDHGKCKVKISRTIQNYTCLISQGICHEPEIFTFFILFKLSLQRPIKIIIGRFYRNDIKLNALEIINTIKLLQLQLGIKAAYTLKSTVSL